MPETSPAEILRSAASLMRERAQAASPGPWHQICMGSDGCQVLNDGHLRERKHVAWFGRKEWKPDHADAEYVASMGPQVALAFAAWLEDRASDYFSLSATEERIIAGDSEAGTEDPAITAARAYLGDPDA